jgi:hypothetical protein
MKMKETDWEKVLVKFDEKTFSIRIHENDKVIFENQYNWNSITRVCYKSYDYGAPDFCYLYFNNSGDEIILPTESKEDCEAFWKKLKEKGLFPSIKEKHAQYSSQPEFNCHDIE